ncbi:PREDICTED: alpha-1,3-mannosyl-glycoprotein 2-beta-N-acetylglucosaminyltransferase-like [Priapulus caudatus]|uniref:Alpha-1,3-mannosyl-glycoprotein 2-beta-N-acetylglucosaminyltransferase n=1 Tax=Priapulus caudatus TaxID=37621 RepID=A0ABM1EKY2_PRICU|nr:PREDICTED: alpha-1,3-mannosyl-glycoprotein 2-beta-N-acetylglucosaminyltransferase-like [Priapulus caudatus]
MAPALLRRCPAGARDPRSQVQTNDELLRLLVAQKDKLGAIDLSRLNVLPPDRDRFEQTGGAAAAVNTSAADGPIIAVLVFSCNRPTVSRNLDQLIKYRPSATSFPIIVSQDCGDKPTAAVIQDYVKRRDVLTHIRQPDLSDIVLPPKQKKFAGYYKIARHYRWALNQAFHELKYDTVIIVEDDLDVAPDFFEYFAATYRVLKADPTLWCVSAWNDNGKPSLIANDPELLHRTDFFPGLGWMLQKSTWLELEPKWPITFWDDWMRHPDQRKGRACIRPEISRTITFGKIGVSKGQYFEQHLKFIKLNTKMVTWTKKDLSYLDEKRYIPEFVERVYSSTPEVGIRQVQAREVSQHDAVRVTYTTQTSFKILSKALGMMTDVKAGVARTAYRGVVSIMFNGQRVYLAPPANWTAYEMWS